MGYTIKLSVLCWMVAIATSSNIGGDRQDINLSPDGGYTDILVAIDERVPESFAIIEKLQSYFREASQVLLTATHNRLYFKSLTIIVPETWTHNSSWSEPVEHEEITKARVIVAEENLGFRDEPYTLQPGNCGQEGDYIHFTPEYLTNKTEKDRTYRPAKRIVKEFAKLKWGLFDETIPVNDKNTSRFYIKDSYTRLKGCMKNPAYKLKNCERYYHQYSFRSPPLPPCDATATKVKGGNASLLAYEFLDEVVDFCSSLSHNSLPDNLQNANCDGQSAWDVMHRLSDFAIDYGHDRAPDFKPNTEFYIVQKAPVHESVEERISESVSCKQDIVCLCLDVSGSMDINQRITVMSEAVQLYIQSILRNGSAVGIVSFSSNAYLKADMTELTTKDVREDLMTKVPKKAGGGTNIAAGIFECQRILTAYTGRDIRKTRILLHSDGHGTIDDSIERITEQGVTLDTVLFDQGGYLAAKANKTGGKEYLASDEFGQFGLLGFYEETASRYCEADSRDAVVQSGQIIIPSNGPSYQGRAYLDSTIGLNTKMVFKYDVKVRVNVSKSLTTEVTEDDNLKVIVITIKDEIDEYVDYTITNDNPNHDASLIVTITSSPIPNVAAIEVNNKVNDRSIQFSASTELISYIGVFQGFTPVLQLTVNIIVEDPTGQLTYMPHNDDGTGKDSVPNDGIYTGHLGAHLIKGASSEGYYGLSIDIAGEGVLPGQEVVGRRKRCVTCGSLGNITRSMIGGVIKVSNWAPVPDTTPPERITDLTVVETSETDSLFTLAWTAPGEDLNIGQASGYEFGVGANETVGALTTLDPAAILSDVTTFLVEAGTLLEMEINASLITPEMLGLPESANISTYYFRLRTYDSNNNYADWSNPVSASYVKPETIIAFLEQMPTPEPTTTEPYTTRETTTYLSTTGEQTTGSYTVSTTQHLTVHETTTEQTTTSELISTTHHLTVHRQGTTAAEHAAPMPTVIILGVVLCAVGSLAVVIGLALAVWARHAGYMKVKQRDWNCGETVVGTLYYPKHMDEDGYWSFGTDDVEKNGAYEDLQQGRYRKLYEDVPNLVAEISEQTHL